MLCWAAAGEDWIISLDHLLEGVAGLDGEGIFPVGALMAPAPLLVPPVLPGAAASGMLLVSLVLGAMGAIGWAGCAGAEAAVLGAPALSVFSVGVLRQAPSIAAISAVIRMRCDRVDMMFPFVYVMHSGANNRPDKMRTVAHSAGFSVIEQPFFDLSQAATNGQNRT